MSHLRVISDAAMLFVRLLPIGPASFAIATSSLQATLNLKADQCTSKDFRFLFFFILLDVTVLMEANRYNLRSNRRECSIPVQIQLATDEDFLTASRSHMESVQAGQVFSELSDSESDIDISNFIRSSDQNLSPITSDKQSASTGGGRDSVPGTSGSNSSLTKKFASN